MRGLSCELHCVCMPVIWRNDMPTLARGVGFLVFLMGMLFLPVTSSARVLDVPADYLGIQVALDSSQSGDTVRVAPGTYNEFLQGPAHNISLVGWYSGDTLPEYRTTLDPIPAGNDTPSVAVFSGDTVVVENFAFYNRPEMRQPDWATRTGGIQHTGERLILRDCRFDSVSRAVNAAQSIESTDCKFYGCLWQCLYASNTGLVRAERCTFDGSGPWLVYCSSGSSIRECDFLCSATRTHFLQMSGHDILVSGCRFGPCDAGFSVLVAYTQGNCVIENCVFESIGRASRLIEIAMQCPGPTGVPIRVSGNTFRSYHQIPPAVGTTAIGLICQNSASGYFGEIYDNIFIDGESSVHSNPGLSIRGSAYLDSNRFEDLRPTDAVAVELHQNFSDSVFARNNLFLGPSIAAASDAFFDARENWWGDSTGPFHPSLNPNGIGTEVGNGVLFEPWLTMHPDSSDTTGSAAETPSILHPSSYVLSAFPNPFNATTTLTIEVPTPGRYDVQLYSVSGQLVNTLYAGHIDSRKRLTIDAGEYASGTYFARLSSSEVHAVTKVVLLR